jgi:hypothetical protein
MLTAMFDFMVIRIPELTEHDEDDSGAAGTQKRAGAARD